MFSFLSHCFSFQKLLFLPDAAPAVLRQVCSFSSSRFSSLTSGGAASASGALVRSGCVNEASIRLREPKSNFRSRIFSTPKEISPKPLAFTSESAGAAAEDAARATRAAGQAAAQAIAGEPAPDAAPDAAPAFVDIEKMRDVVETSRSMSDQTKAEILQLLDAAALDPSKLDAALVKYRAALQ